MTEAAGDLYERIELLAGRYNLPDGVVPVVDGVPAWPWSEAVAHQRLRRVAGHLRLDLPGDECLLSSGSNDVWLIGGRVLRICWRGNIDRLVKEASLCSVLPRSMLCPPVLDHGRDEHLSWILAPRVCGDSLDQVWAATPERELRGYASQMAQMLIELHRWVPGPAISGLLSRGEPADGDDAVAIAGKTITPLDLAHQQRLIECARSMPNVDGGLLDHITERLAGVQAHVTVRSSPRVFLHGDFTPWNVLVHDGRLCVFDYEWARFGPADTDLLMPMIWSARHDPVCAGRLIRWLEQDYPTLFAAPDLIERLWLYHVAFALRGMIHWPPDQLERDLEPDHPQLLLRELANQK